MARPLVILHGYSDTSRTFEAMAERLADRLGTTVSPIALGDYVTLNDYVTFDDLRAGMDRAWTEFGLPRGDRSVDMVVHSTGALVARLWLAGLAAGPGPVHHLVMLAPANFGSPLAHKGQSFIGRVLKGFQDNGDAPMHSGLLVLKGLELASPMQWDLAHRDRFGSASRFDAGGCLCTVIVGNTGYDGIAAIANEAGSDGTVRLSTANMNCAKLTIDFTKSPMAPAATLTESRGRCGYLVMDGFDHSTITLSGLPASRHSAVIDEVVAALTVTDARFASYCDSLDRRTATLVSAMAKRRGDDQNGFQNTVVRVLDDQERPVRDYLVEFYEEDDDRNIIAKLFHTTALANVHVHSDDASLRSLYVNCTKLTKMIDRGGEGLSISLSASPTLEQSFNRVGFKSFNDRDVGGLRLPWEEIGTYFAPNRTLLVDMRLKWHQGDLFRLRERTEPYTRL
jgi:pimeloyl-ACP methyl ester carboxylesterase